MDGFIAGQVRKHRGRNGLPLDQDLIMEIAQEVRIRIMNRVASGNSLGGGEAGLCAYIRDTTRHVWLDAVSGRYQAEVSVSPVGDGAETGDGMAFNPLATLADPTGDPLDRLLAHEEQEEACRVFEDAAWTAIRKLDAAKPKKGYLKLFELQVRSWQDESEGRPRISQIDMAQALQCSQAAISGRLQEVWAHLRQVLPELEAPLPPREGSVAR
jgi:DNA-directed RNA polymerase specialized sigma24 family protein